MRFLTVLMALLVTGVSCSNFERKLVKDLKSRLQNAIVTNNKSYSIKNININFRLVEVLKLSAKQQVLESSAWIEQSWTDNTLKWDKMNYGGIDEVTIDHESVWYPDTVLLNNADSSTMGNPVTVGYNIMVSSNGNVHWLAPVVLKSSCKLNVRFFPFDEQFCGLEFTSWASGQSDLEIQPGTNKILSNYTESTEWHLRGVMVGKIRVKGSYPLDSSKTGVLYVIYIRRQVFYYFLYLITPCLLVSLLTALLFLLPPDSGELMVVGVTLLLSLTVFFLLASTHIPETSEVVPLIGRYYSLTILQISCSLGFACYILRLHHHSTSFGSMSSWQKVLIFKYLAKIAGFSVPRQLLSHEESANVASASGGNPSKEPSALRDLVDRLNSKEEKEKKQDEWQMAAKILDRIFLVLYLITVVVTLIGLFIQVPQLMGQQPDLSLSTFDAYVYANYLEKERLETYKT